MNVFLIFKFNRKNIFGGVLINVECAPRNTSPLFLRCQSAGNDMDEKLIAFFSFLIFFLNFFSVWAWKVSKSGEKKIHWNGNREIKKNSCSQLQIDETRNHSLVWNSFLCCRIILIEKRIMFVVMQCIRNDRWNIRKPLRDVCFYCLHLVSSRAVHEIRYRFWILNTHNFLCTCLLQLTSTTKFVRNSLRMRAMAIAFLCAKIQVENKSDELHARTLEAKCVV